MRNLSLLLILSAGLISNAQDLIESRQTSYYTYIYELSDREARRIHKKDLWQVDESYFHTLVDSFHTDSTFRNTLPVGHYLKVHSERNKLRFDITSVQDFDVMLAKNQTDLALQVFDLEGKIIPDADLRIRSKKLRFDGKTQSYRDRKSNQKGLLRVSHNGFTAYYNLSRYYNNSSLRRTTRKLVYGTPLQYVWKPIRYTIYLPIDGVKSLIRGWPQGSIQRTVWFFEELIDGGNFQDKHKGYMVFNKPKYMPGDTVKLKAFIVDKKGKPVNAPANLYLQCPGKVQKIATVSPYSGGAFSYEFFLHDSLELRLDRSYRAWFGKNQWKTYISNSFHYEDYELRSIHLDLAVDDKVQYRGEEVSLRVRGTDENDLNLLDGRLEILVRPLEVNKYFGKYVFIPDTLAFWEQDLDRNGETKVVIPDSIFPSVNMSYKVSVVLLTSDNERIVKNEQIDYYSFRSEISYGLEADSLNIGYELDGQELPVRAKIYGIDNFGNRTEIDACELPVQLPVNPYYADILVDADSVVKAIGLAGEPSLVQCFTERTRDSIWLRVDNPRNLPFSYYIYKKNTEKSRGHADSLDLDFRAGSRQKYYLSIQYLWGGRLFDDNYEIPYDGKRLNVSVLEPRLVYPSQSTNIELRVTDQEGNPVPGVDLTAYGMTKKFNSTPPQLPYLGRQAGNKMVINNFTLSTETFSSQPRLDLDYPSWRILAGLDSIEYYKFIYPGNEIYQIRYESGITQVAPFVVSGGSMEPVHVVYIDHKPVYFSWSTNTRPYSFQVDSGYHHLKLRTSGQMFEIDSFYVKEGTKTILSLWDSIVHPGVRVSAMEPNLSVKEKRVLYKYIFPYRYHFGEYYGFIQQYGQVQHLKPQGYSGGKNLAGPVSPNRVSFELIDSFSTSFIHEPFYEYEFQPGLLKMRSKDPDLWYPDYLKGIQVVQGLTDQVITVEDIHQGWQDYLDMKRYSTARYTYPHSTSPGHGRMITHLEGEPGEVSAKLLNILLFKHDDPEFVRVYPGNIRVFNDITEGYYRMIYFYPGAEYAVFDSLFIAADGENFHELYQTGTLEKDSFSIRVSSLIEENLFKPRPYSWVQNEEERRIFRSYQQEFNFTGEGDVVDGYVYDEDGGESLPGVNVVVKGTTFGAVTDMQGYYSLKVPRDRDVLVFSFIGCETQEVALGYNDQVNIYLTPSSVALDEVVVTAMGMSRKTEMVSASVVGKVSGVSGVNAQLVPSLQGKVSGLMVDDIKFKNDEELSIVIRGSSSVSFNAMPLLVIDGYVYDGSMDELDPSIIKDLQVLKGDRATALYGARGVHGVVLINTGGSFKQAGPRPVAGADFDDVFLESASRSSSIRNNFSDYAFWQPTLTTDEDGKASFRVKFPDDVTSWKTYYLAMNGKKQSGQAEGAIKSYKPLMAQLAVPRFLVENDTACAIGKVRHYTSDSIALTTRFELEHELVSEQKRGCAGSLIDTLEITAGPVDSVSVKYFLENEDGYFDGEQRSIPVFPMGLEETTGQFLALDGDTSISMTFDTSVMTVSLYARADVLEEIDTEISKLIRYKYSCNEQLASKLKALLMERNICQFRGESFKKTKQVQRMIRLLMQNQHDDGLWGWWKSSETSSLWISMHVLEALVQAKGMGYRVILDKGTISDYLVLELEGRMSVENKLRALNILNLLKARVDYPAYIAKLEQTEKVSYSQLFRLIELKQNCRLAFNLDTLDHFRRHTLLGNVYYSADSANFGLLNNDMQNTLSAYRIFRVEGQHQHTLKKIRNYLFESRSNGSWTNTYETARIIETILPDLLREEFSIEAPKLKFTGALNCTVLEFPLDTTLSSGDALQIEKMGDYPVYLTAYQRYWNTSPVLKDTDFSIRTHFKDIEGTYLEAGSKVSLMVTLDVKKDADYVMINVPIPAGCSYGDKSVSSFREVHREYFRNETAIFCESLQKGLYEFEIKLLPRYSGRYILNPAKVEMMYFPTFNANNEIKKVTIE